MSLSSLPLRQWRFGASNFQPLNFGRRLLSSHPSLSNWHRAVSEVPLSKILPIGYGGETDYANTAAYYGDKRIGYEVALELERFCAATSKPVTSTTETCDASTTTSSDSTTPEGTFHPSPGWLTSITVQAISNRLFSDKFAEILPLHSQNVPRRLLQVQMHDAGTMVEAAVDAVAKLEKSRENQDSSNTKPQQTVLSELARYLIDSTFHQGPVNAKGQVLEAGGTVTSEEVLGAKLQDPNEKLFRASAHLDGNTGHGEGRNKREAEQAACTKVLEKITSASPSHCGPDGSDISTLFRTTERVNIFERLEETQAAATGDKKDMTEDDMIDSKLFWEIKLDSSSASMNLKNGESPEEWWRRSAHRPKNAHHRAMMAPLVFPDQVVAVQTWLQRPKTLNTTSTSEQTTNVVGAEDELQYDVSSTATPEYGCTVLMVVVGHPISTNITVHDGPQRPVMSSFLEYAPNRTQAVKLAGIATNRFIATKILGHEDPLDAATDVAVAQ